MHNDQFQWDDIKAVANYRKHGVSFEEGAFVFRDIAAVEEIDPRSSDYGEERWLVVGIVSGRLLTVVFTERGEQLRIISARESTKEEHDNYYRQNSQE